MPFRRWARCLLAIALGLCGGYLDLLVMIFQEILSGMISGTFGAAAIFLGASRSYTRSCWAIAGVLVAIVNWVRPGRRITLRAGAWLFATLAIWAALLRMPLYGVCTLLLAAGLARPISTAVVAYSRHPRHARHAWRGSSAC